jgi:phosphoribosylaminoimidazole-succinocarboxamide synthase
MSRNPLLATEIPGIPCRRGKVRDIYDLGDRLVIVASDRISAFDWVLPTPIPDKGRILTGLTVFWLNLLKVPNHLISTRLEDMGPEFVARRELLEGRAMLVRKAQVIPIECVARGYLAGSGWKEYKQQGTVCGIALPPGLVESQQLPEPIFTPATKEESGHDINISFEEMARRIGRKPRNFCGRKRWLCIGKQRNMLASVALSSPTPNWNGDVCRMGRSFSLMKFSRLIARVFGRLISIVLVPVRLHSTSNSSVIG